MQDKLFYVIAGGKVGNKHVSWSGHMQGKDVDDLTAKVSKLLKTRVTRLSAKEIKVKFPVAV